MSHFFIWLKSPCFPGLAGCARGDALLGLFCHLLGFVSVKLVLDLLEQASVCSDAVTQW